MKAFINDVVKEIDSGERVEIPEGSVVFEDDRKRISVTIEGDKIRIYKSEKTAGEGRIVIIPEASNVVIIS